MAEERRTTIGVLTEEVANAYSEPILRELDEVARERGVSLLYFVEWLEPKDLSERRFLTTDLAGPQNVDAVLVLPLGYSLSARDLAGYCERFRPLPICSIPDIAADFSSRVSVDNDAGLRAGLEHLIHTHGLTRIAFVRGPELSDEATLRYAVYRDVLEQNGLALDEQLVTQGYYVVQSGVDAVRALFDERKLRPEAIVCANDGMALGVLQELTARGVLVPDDIALVGFDDIEIARYLDPPLTTVRQPLAELGRTALEVLLDQLTNGGAPRHVVLPSELVIRESCGCLAYRTPGARASSVPHDAQVGLDALMLRAPQVVAALEAFSIAGISGSEWSESLYRAFVGEVSGEPGVFLRELRQLLDSVSAMRGDVGSLHRVVTVLGQFVRKNLLAGSPEWQRADSLLHAARVRISGVAQRAPSSQQVRLVDATYKFTRASNALSQAVDYAAMSQVLAEHLPSLGISSCYVCEYASPELTSSRLVSGFDGNGALALSAAGTPFETRELAPADVLRSLASGNRLVGPLRRTGLSPGFVLFARDAAEGFVYENLLVQIGSVVDRLRLVRELVEAVERRELAERERLEREMAIAKRIQTGILPRRALVPGLEIAGVMLPATEVGGDYYDVISIPGGCWIGIGDVAGHGLPAGLVMLMVQSLVSGVVRATPSALPSAALATINEALFENLRERMGQDEFVTFSLLRYKDDGTLLVAGAHEDLLLYRHASRSSEWLPTVGTWLGVVRDVRDVTVDTPLALGRGDLLVIFSDGIVEAQNAQGELYALERLQQSVERVTHEPVERICDTLIADVRAWMAEQLDDITVLVIRRTA
ncbi:MAG TPA: substrate-binding domain-containing protein [Polyangiaceae bacterium]